MAKAPQISRFKTNPLDWWSLIGGVNQFLTQ